MRINRYIALSTGMSRRAADKAVSEQRIHINDKLATMGTEVIGTDSVELDGVLISPPAATTTIMLNKPVGYVTSRNGQGSKTIYDLLPKELHDLKPIGRLDKDSSGLLLLTNDGPFAHELTHPSKQKIKIYEIELNKSLEPLHRQMIQEFGVQLEDGPSKFIVERQKDGDDIHWRITMREGRNRQIRRTFASLGYTVTKLHRKVFGDFTLMNTEPGNYIITDMKP